MRIRRTRFLILCYVPVLAVLSANTAGGQSIFYARDLLLTLSFQQGRDINPESPGFPMAVTPGGTYIAATFQISGLDFAGFLRKYDSDGKEVWTRQVAASRPAFVSALAADTSAVYVIGAVGFGRPELFVVKYDASGNELWSRQLFIKDGYHAAAGVAIDASGLYVAAWALDQGLVSKYSPAGDELWSRPLPFRVRSMRGLAISDGVYAAGVNDTGGFVVKLTAGGDIAWTNQLNSSDTETQVPAAIATDGTGIYLGGTVFRRIDPSDPTFIPSTGDAFLRKLDANGTELWARRFVTSIPNSIVSLAVDQDAIYTAGGTSSILPGQCKAGGGADLFVRRYDAAGAEQWTRQFGTSVFDMPGNLAVDASGIYLSGAVRGIEQAGAFIVKLPKTQPLTAGTKPAISWECVVNAASYAGGGVAPGEIVTIFGRAMAQDPVTYQLGPDGRLSTALGTTRVLFNGIAAPMLYASAGQINAIVPNSVSGGPTASVEVEYRGVRSDALTVPVAPARPGIFTIDGSGMRQGAIINEDMTINSPANPAMRGSVIAVYATGGGLTDPPLPDGSILTGAPPLVKQPLEIYFDDPTEVGSISPADVLFAGAAPQSVAGLVQINVRVPDWVKPGDAVAIYLRSGNQYVAEEGVKVAVR